MNCRLCGKKNVFVPSETPETKRCQCAGLPLARCSVCGESRHPLVLYAGICGSHEVEHIARVRELTSEQLMAMQLARLPQNNVRAA